MPAGLRLIDPPAEHRDACRAFAVLDGADVIGHVVLVLAQRPHGATVRRLWWAIRPAADPRPLPRPFDTRAAAVHAVRYRHATLNQPRPMDPVDTTLTAVRAAYDNAGPTAAVWLAASLTIHHLSELDANRHANPPSLWRELRRVVAWLQAATGHTEHRLSNSVVHYRRTIDGPQ